MSAVRAVVDTVVGLFVTDWRELLGIALVLAVGGVVVARTPGTPTGALLAVALGGHLVVATVLDARRRLRARRPER